MYEFTTHSLEKVFDLENMNDDELIKLRDDLRLYCSCTDCIDCIHMMDGICDLAAYGHALEVIV